MIDWHSGVRRTSTKADLAAITRLTDYLGSVQFWWPTVAAADCGDTHTLHELDAGLEQHGQASAGHGAGRA